MRTTLSLTARWRMAGMVGVAAFATSACELLVDFDRSLIPQEGGIEDATFVEAGEEGEEMVDAGPFDATVGEDVATGSDATGDGAADATLDAPADALPNAAADSPAPDSSSAEAAVEAGADVSTDSAGQTGSDATIDAVAESGGGVGTGEDAEGQDAEGEGGDD